ncbi:hypothetical protein ACTD5D_10375 [Nocardia takedensis]|uniref:hypothetical protein n=1 Tax=Nocardia takedensis TaxID=259390 RepID=UPI003F77351F
MTAHHETIHQLEWPAEPRGEVSGVRSQELLSRQPLFTAGIHSSSYSSHPGTYSPPRLVQP